MTRVDRLVTLCAGIAAAPDRGWQFSNRSCLNQAEELLTMIEESCNGEGEALADILESLALDAENGGFEDCTPLEMVRYCQDALINGTGE